jgi:succinoglycan biosynthesis protein ExoV
MRLVYFSGHGNFGDELNAVLWPRLAAEQFATADRIGFLGIGTVIGMPTPECDFLHVFSSGVGYDRLAGWSVPRRIWCVRGPLTAHMLGADLGAAITDGAILAPSIITEETSITEEAGPADPAAVGVMPHWQSLHAPGWQRACDLAGFTLLDPIGEPAGVIRALRRMHLVLTESLHGAIVADSYGIPWVPICTSRNFSVFKWMDWCLSMEVGLATVMVPPPSIDALLRFGRPAPARWGDRVIFSTCDAVDEFDRRTSIAPATATPPGLPAHARALLRPALARSGPLLGPLGRLAGYAPARTAAHLTRAAQAPPTLSRAALRAQRCDQMMQRLDELRHAMAQGAMA